MTYYISRFELSKNTDIDEAKAIGSRDIYVLNPTYTNTTVMITLTTLDTNDFDLVNIGKPLDIRYGEKIYKVHVTSKEIRRLAKNRYELQILGIINDHDQITIIENQNRKLISKIDETINELN